MNAFLIEEAHNKNINTVPVVVPVPENSRLLAVKSINRN